MLLRVKLRNVFWRYLLPPGIGLAGLYAAVLYRVWPALPSARGAVAQMALLLAGTILLMVWIYRLNQKAVRQELLPRQRELQELLDAPQDG